MDLFVVVVGVDPRWVLRSLRHRFHQVFTHPEGSERDDAYSQSTPQNYLEKIFQIPFVLPAMSAQGYRELLNSLIRSSGTTGPSPTASDTPSDIPVEEGSAVAAIMSKTQPSSVGLDLTNEEVAILAALSPLVRTPRAAKRMLNIYRMLRATRDLGPASGFLAGDYQAVAQLLGLLTGYPHLYRPFVWGDPGASNGETLGLIKRSGGTWAELIDELVPRESAPRRWSNAVRTGIPVSEVKEWIAAKEGLAAARPTLTLPDVDLAVYQLWAPRIARFCFELAPYAHAIGPGG